MAEHTDETVVTMERHVRIAGDTKDNDEEEEVMQEEKKSDEKAAAEIGKECAAGGDGKHGRQKERQGLTVLIPVDGSGPSNKAVDWYLTDLHKKNNRLVFVHIFELPAMHSYQEMYVNSEVWNSTLKHEADRTAKMEKMFMRRLNNRQIEGKFLAKGGGKPGETIIRTAQEEDADLVVMGTRGHGKFMRVLLGSVSNYVTNHAHCPVMVYRHKKEKPRSRSRSGSPSKKGKHQTESEPAKSSDEDKGKNKGKNKVKETKED